MCLILIARPAPAAEHTVCPRSWENGGEQRDTRRRLTYSMQILLEIGLIVLLLGLNAFLAASEISLVSARKPRLRALADDGNHAAGRVLALAESPSGFLATVQVGITLAGFFAAAVGAVSMTDVLEDWIEAIPIDFISDHASGVALVLVTVLLSFVSIVFGELVPKTLAVSRAESVALRVVRPIE